MHCLHENYIKAVYLLKGIEKPLQFAMVESKKEFPNFTKEEYDCGTKLFLQFLQNSDYSLQRFVQIDGVEYGFEPNLSQMSYGAYLDCIKWDTITIDKNWSKIMSILYRPVKKKVGLLYEIEPYSGVVDEKKFLETGMDVNFGALFFFIDLLKTLSNSILKSMKDQMEIFPQLNTILERNGNPILLSTNWQTEILQNSIRL
jgi:hypothetical protein